MKNRYNSYPSEIIQRVLNQIDHIFYQYQQEKADDLGIIFDYLKFTAFAMENKKKLQELLIRNRVLAVTWSEQY